MPAPPLIDYRPVPQALVPVYAAARNAMIAAGVAEDKLDGRAADLEAAINDAIHKQTDGLRWFGKIAIASLVPLWIIALVALFRHQRVRVDLAHLEEIIRQANRITPPPADDDATTPFCSASMIAGSITLANDFNR